MLDKYPNQVKYVIMHFPLKSHKFARKAAASALAAGKQGKFWEYNTLLFENYNAINDDKMEKFATGLSLNMEQFNKDTNDKGIAKMISKDIENGVVAGVRGTPTIFINGRRLQNRSLQGFQQVIDKLLQN